MIISVILFIVSFIYLSLGFMGLSQNAEGFLLDILAGLAAAAIGFVLFSKSKSKAEPSSEPSVEPIAEFPPVVETPEKIYRCKVAGVTFDNRQDVLRRLYLDGQKSFDGNVVIEDNITVAPYLFEGDIAYSVNYDGVQVGSIPKESIDDFNIIDARITNSILLINWFSDEEKKQRIYYASLTIRYK